MAVAVSSFKHLRRSFFWQFSVCLRRIWVSETSELECKEERPSLLTKRKVKEEGMQTHARYHIKVKEFAAEFRQKRIEEEKQLNAEQQKKKDIRKLETEMHERFMEHINMENQKMELQRKQRKESEKVVNEQLNRRRLESNREIQSKQQQERIGHVMNAIEESNNWVTKENLEEKIAYCLEQETHYNFALCPTGKRIYSISPPGCQDTKENAPGPAAYLTTGLPKADHST